jgi:hypothetical protein
MNDCRRARPPALIVTFLSVRNCDFSIRERQNFGFTVSASGFFKAAVVCPFPASGVRCGSSSVCGFGDRRCLRPRRPSKSLPVSPHDRRRRFQPNADAAALIDIGAFGGNAPEDILGGQYPRHLRPPRQVCLQAMQFSVLTTMAPQLVSPVSPGLQASGPGANETRQNDGDYASRRRRKHGTKRSRDFHGVR